MNLLPDTMRIEVQLLIEEYLGRELVCKITNVEHRGIAEQGRTVGSRRSSRNT